MSDLVLVAVAGEGRVCVLRLAGDAPRLEVLTRPESAPSLPGCGTFAVDPGRDLVYAAYKGDPPGIATLRLDRETGALTEVGRRDVPDAMTYLSLAHDDAVLLGASYGGGVGLTWPLEEGRLGEPVGRVTHRNLHCVVTADDPTGVRAYVVSLGDDLVAQLHLGHDGSLTPLDPPTVSAPEGSGPRHLVVDGAAAYLTTEFSGELIRFSRNADGTLAEEQRVLVVDPSAGLAHSRLGADPQQEHLIWGADVHRAGAWVLTSERSSSRLTSTPLLPDGSLGAPAHFTETEAQPRGFAVTPDGRHVVAVGERSSEAALSRVEPDGSLTLLQRVEIGRGANWVRVLPLA